MRYGSVKKVASLPRTADTCVKEEGGKSWKLSRSNTTSSRSEALLHYGTTSLFFLLFPPVCFCDISVVNFTLLSTLPIPKFNWKKIVLKFIRKSWAAMRCFLSTPFYAIRVWLFQNEKPLRFSRTSLNGRFL